VIKVFSRDFFTKEKVRRILMYGIYMFVCLIFQEMFFSKLRPLGVCPMFLPAVVAAVGMFEGVTWGAIFGLVMGIFADMAYVETTVMFTLAYPVIAFAVGFVAQFFINRRFLAYMVCAVGALLAAALVQMLRVVAVSGFSFYAIETVILQVVWSVPLAAIVYFPPAKWIE